jgi:NAD(P)-dependent dehydrogenase (short-subunit alcohol dehydrogenase family)
MTRNPMSQSSLLGTVSLVTGSSRGIGRATIRRLAAAGSDVCISYLNSPREARELAEEVVGMNRRAIVVKADIANPDDVHAMCQIVGDEYGKLDIVVSNAAGGGFRPLLEASVEQLMRSFQVNVAALLTLAHAAVPLLRKTSLPRSKLITLSSLGGTRALPSYGLVGAAKGAVESITRQLALELGPLGVNVNCVCGGLVNTGALASMPDRDARLQNRRKRSLIGDRDLVADDLANVVVALAGPLLDAMQGQTLFVDGGTSIQV